MSKKKVQLALQELYDNAINNAKILRSDKSKLQILVTKEDVTNISIMTPQTISNSANIFNNLATANNVLTTVNAHTVILNKVLPLLEQAQKWLIQSFQNK